MIRSNQFKISILFSLILFVFSEFTPQIQTMKKIHPVSMKRNIAIRDAMETPSETGAQKTLRRLPHVFGKVLELPFRSDADVSVEETDDFFRFVAETDESIGDDVSAHAVEIHPGVTKIVVRNGGGGGEVVELLLGALEVDAWRFRLPAMTLPEMASAVFVDGELIVTVPKSGDFAGGEGLGGVRRLVLVYALMSFLSLVLNESAIYFNSIREIYEAWVIYNFLALCLAWVGGPGAVVLSLSGRVLKPSWYLMTCFFSPIPLDGRFIRRCKQGCLQFVILKPVLVAVTFILYAKGKYHDGNFSVDQSYLYLTVIYTVSYSVAPYSLALFYVACRDLLQPFNPVPKFIIIKSVVFLTYWQGVLVFLAAKSGFIRDTEEAAEFQNFIICVEMLIAAVGHLYTFPYKEYAGANIGVSRGFTASLAHALKLNDFYHDTVHQFAPTYHDYVLYNHGEGEVGPRKYRARTFVPTGPEMDTVRKNKHLFGNKLDDVQLSSLPSSGNTTPQNLGTMHNTKNSEAMNSSLLMDVSHSHNVPYDLSLIDIDMATYSARFLQLKNLELGNEARIPKRSLAF